MQLTWRNAFSIHLGQPSNTYISNIESSYNGNQDTPSQTYVELGLFKKTDELTNPNLDYFFLVNRRTLPTEQRFIKATINKPNSIYTNWKINEVGSNNYWIVSKTGYFETNYKPGEGKLFRLEPLYVSGGSLATNDTIPESANVVVLDDILVSSNSALVIQKGSSLAFAENKSMTVYGTLTAINTPTQRITFSSDQPTITNWDKIKIYSHDNGSVLRNCDIEFSTNGLEIEYVGKDPDVVIDSCNFRNNINQAISIYNPGCGTNFEPVISNNFITDSDFGIYNNHGSPEISYNRIENCNSAILSYNSFANIHHNIIHNFSGGISLNNCSGTLTDNRLSNGDSYGVLISGGSPYFYRNTIDTSDVGVYCVNSTPQFGHRAQTGYGNNVIRNDSIGVYSYNSQPFLGGYDAVNETNFGGYNSIYNSQQYHVKATDHTIVEAQYNWWGSANPSPSKFYSDQTSSIDWYNYLDYDPNQALRLAKGIIGGKERDIDLERNDNLTPLSPIFISAEFDSASRKWSKQQVLMYAGSVLRANRKYSDAVKVYKKIIELDKKKKYAVFALRALQQTYRECKSDSLSIVNCTLSIDELKQYCQSIIDSSKKSKYKISALAHSILAEEYLKGNNIFKSIEYYEKLGNNFKGGEDELLSLFGLFNIYYFSQRDTLASRTILNKMKAKFPDELLTQIAINTIDRKSGSKLFFKPSGLVLSENTDANETYPKEFKLYQNYPNPFNPTTTLSYTLKDPSFVTISIYNILGEEVDRITMGFESEGSYRVNFNANKFSSGVYIYKLEARDESGKISYIDSKKMLLMK